jgi:type II secretion system protein N
MGAFLQFILNIFRNHKLKLFATGFSAFLFLVLLFPYDDLSEVVSTMIAERTNNQVLLQFDRLSFEVFPLPALSVQNVAVESSFLPSLQASRISLAPSISGFLSFRPGFTASIHDVWNGRANVEMMTLKKNEQGAPTQSLNLHIERIDLNKANEALDLPLKLQGTVGGDSRLVIDPSFATQPEGEVTLLIKELRFPSGTVPTQMGPVNLPGLSWNHVQIKGRLSGGKMTLEQAELGSASDMVNGTLKGDIEVKLDPRGAGQVGLKFGAYSLLVDLSVNAKVEKDLTLFVALLGSYKSATTTGARYKFKVAGQQFGLTPSISPAVGL